MMGLSCRINEQRNKKSYEIFIFNNVALEKNLIESILLTLYKIDSNEINYLYWTFNLKPLITIILIE